MWQTRIETLREARAYKYYLLSGKVRLSYAEVLELWRTSDEFRSFFVSLLVEAPIAAYRWETPPVTATTVGRDFEFVLLRNDALVRAVDRAAFADHFTDDEVVVFANLSGDATMIVPCPVADGASYGHLASFVRSAPRAQVHRLWRAVGEVVRAQLGARPVWLSTAGMGVAWLHVRLDSRPKYYGHAPYK